LLDTYHEYVIFLPEINKLNTLNKTKAKQMNNIKSKSDFSNASFLDRKYFLALRGYCYEDIAKRLRTSRANIHQMLKNNNKKRLSSFLSSKLFQEMLEKDLKLQTLSEKNAH